MIIPAASFKTTPEKTEPNGILDVLGPRIQFLTALSDNDSEYCLIKGTSVVVPIHSHPERDTFYVLGREVEGFWEDRWTTLGVGDVCDVPGGLKHGWGNLSARRRLCWGWCTMGWAGSFAISAYR